MDVQRWQITLLGNSGNYDNEPGLGLRVLLKCRICDSTVVAVDARKIRPLDLKPRTPIVDWFDFQVKNRLGMPRYCGECGTGSVIPGRQQQRLIALANPLVTTEWLQGAIASLELRIRTLPETHEYYARDVFSSCAGEHVMEWRDFEPALV